jgi:histidinol phosphatase-like enzyme (inositol monophosphatase family)
VGDAGTIDEARARLELARRLAREAGRLALTWYQSPDLEVERKPDDSVVTPVDRRAEEDIRRGVEAAFPDDGFLGEELDARAGRSGWRWVVDPIDGTLSYVHGIPHFCTLIGLEHGGRAVAGVAEYPALDESLHAVAGDGATWRTRSGVERPARVSDATDLREAFLELGSPGGFAWDGVADGRERLERTAARVRGWSDGYAFALVATGRVDGAVQIGLNRWDVCPFGPILEEAGGRVTGWDGAPAPDGGRVIAAGPALHAALVEALGT